MPLKSHEHRRWFSMFLGHLSSTKGRLLDEFPFTKHAMIFPTNYAHMIDDFPIFSHEKSPWIGAFEFHVATVKSWVTWETPGDVLILMAAKSHQLIDGKHPMILFGFQPSKIAGFLPSTVVPCAASGCWWGLWIIDENLWNMLVLSS